MKSSATASAGSLILIVAFVCGGMVATAFDDGALYLTPLIRAGRLDKARAACRVKPVVGDVESYAGYLTVDEAHGSNTFIWFFPAVSGAPDAPVLLWLQGGPGASSLFGLFEEHGPFFVRKDGGLEQRNYTWTATHSVLYVDNPVGTGFSFTGDDAGYSNNQTSVGLNVYEALVQFFTLFAEYRDNDFYVTGESYAGKYVPAVSYAIHLNNPGAQFKINLKGLAIGNGLIDPINQLQYGEYLYQHGLLDDDGKRQFIVLENQVRGQIVSGDFKGAFETFDKLLNGDIYPYPSLFYNRTGMEYYFNLLRDRDTSPFGSWAKYVQQPFMRSALHVGQRPLNNGTAVEKHLVNDVMQSVSTWLAALLDSGRYRVLLYSGQLDIIVPYRGTMQLAQALPWSGAEGFRNATRTIWRVQGQPSWPTVQGDGGDDDNVTDVAGYATAFGPLTVVMVRDAGHMVPADQPVWGLDLIYRFTTGKPFG